MGRTRSISRLTLAFFASNVVLISLAVTFLCPFASAMTFGTVGVEAIEVALIPWSFAILATAISCCHISRGVVGQERSTALWFCLLLIVYIFCGIVAVIFGYLVLSAVHMLEVVAVIPGDSLHLRNHAGNAFVSSLVHISLIRMSDVMLGVYTSCCDEDIIGPCREVIPTHGSTFCYADKEHYDLGRIALPELVDHNGYPPRNASFCLALHVTPREFCPSNSTGIYRHDIPGFLEAVYCEIAPLYSFIGIAAMTVGAVFLLLSLFFCVYERKGGAVPQTFADRAEKFEYGTAIKAANNEVIYV